MQETDLDKDTKKEKPPWYICHDNERRKLLQHKLLKLFLNM